MDMVSLHHSTLASRSSMPPLPFPQFQRRCDEIESIKLVSCPCLKAAAASKRKPSPRCTAVVPTTDRQGQRQRPRPPTHACMHAPTACMALLLSRFRNDRSTRGAAASDNRTVGADLRGQGQRGRARARSGGVSHPGAGGGGGGKGERDRADAGERQHVHGFSATTTPQPVRSPLAIVCLHTRAASCGWLVGSGAGRGGGSTTAKADSATIESARSAHPKSVTSAYVTKLQVFRSIRP